MKLAVVIPAKNEEHRLPALLGTIEAQTVKPDEVIVVDSHSTDETVKIAQSFADRLPIHVQTAVGKGVASARNEGAAATTCDYLVFIDADVTVPPNFIDAIKKTIERRHVEVGAITQRIASKKFGLAFGGRMMNGYMRVMSLTPWPLFFSCYFMSHKIHDEIGGFDPEIFVMEDYDYALRGKRAGGKFGIVKDTFFHSSPRRYEATDGNKSIMQGFYAEFYRYTHGMRVTKKLFDYDMGGEPEEHAKKK